VSTRTIRTLALLGTAVAALLALVALVGPARTGGYETVSHDTGRGTGGAGVVSGRVTVRGTGQPYPGAVVEFTGGSGEGVFVQTDANGEYALVLPADLHTAVALDPGDAETGFAVVGGSAAVPVARSTTVDFEAYEIAPGHRPVP
jgi:hypothetical protein